MTARIRIEGKPEDVAAVAEVLHLVLAIAHESTDQKNTHPEDGNVRRYLTSVGVPFLPDPRD